MQGDNLVITVENISVDKAYEIFEDEEKREKEKRKGKPRTRARGMR
ncbi:hypothetical protein ACFL35_18910 [Candidatus Riflebacteria bacterium]